MRRIASSLQWMLALSFLFILAACSSSEPVPDGADEAGSESELTATSTDGDAEASEEDAEKEKKPRRERAINVTASTVLKGNLVLPIIAEGSIRARRASEMKFEIGGRINRIHVEEGQRVSRGQRLVTIDDREYRVALEEAQARYLDALARLSVEEDQLNSDESAARELESKLDELVKLEREGKISRDERRERELLLGVDAVKDGAYRRELLEVRSGLAAARADEQRATLNLERTVVRAPFDGVISGLTLNNGERVATQATVCSVVDDISLEAEVGVLESDLKLLKVNRGALLELPALGVTVEAIVDVISPQIDSDSRTCRVLLRLDSDGGRVKPGMFVRASIAGSILEDRILVPREAILTRDGRPLLFKVDGDRSKWLYVKLGQRNDALIEIASVLQGGPLVAGDQIIVDNHLTLTHDAKIKVRKTQEVVDPWIALGATEAAIN